MRHKHVRLSLLLMLALLVAVFIGTPGEATAAPTCTTSGTGFHSTEPMLGYGKTVCGSGGQYQNPVWCQIGTMHYTYDCVYENGSYHPVNVVGTPQYCQCAGWGWLLCC